MGCDEVLAGYGSGRFPAGRGALPRRARRHELREPARDARRPERTSAKLDEHFPGKMLLAEANQWPADCVPISEMATSSNGVSFSADAPDVHGIKLEDRKPITEILAADSRDSAFVPVVAFPAQP